MHLNIIHTLVFHIFTHMWLGFIWCYLNTLIEWRNSSTLLYLMELSLFSSVKLWRRSLQKYDSLEVKLVMLNWFDRGDEHSNPSILEWINSVKYSWQCSFISQGYSINYEMQKLLASRNLPLKLSGQSITGYFTLYGYSWVFNTHNNFLECSSYS